MSTATIPTTPLDYPAVEVAQSNRDRVRAELAQIEAEIETFLEAHRGANDRSAANHDFDADVENVLSGEVAQPTMAFKDDERYDRLCLRRRVPIAAVAKADAKVLEAVQSVSRQHAEALRPEYTELVCAMAAAMEELNNLARREHEFRSDVIEAGFAWQLEPMFGIPRHAARDFDECNFFATFVAAAKKHYSY